MDIQQYMTDIGRAARKASRAMAKADTSAKNRALELIAAAIRRDAALLTAANQKDLDAARANGLAPAMVDRLTLSEKAIATMAEGLEQIASLPDPIGEISNMKYRPTGIQVGQMRVPLGVIGIIYEARPNVTVDAAGLCLKSGNAALLRGSSSAQATNEVLVDVLRGALAESGLPADAWTIVTGDGAEVGNAVTDCSDYVAFTGSTETGRRVYERAAGNFIGASLELGGKNPMIVLAGANPARAAEMAIGGAFGSAGQLCVSIERVYVHDSIYDAFVSELTARTEGLSIGRSAAFDFDLGSLTGPNQLARVSGLVEDALAQGASLAAGGRLLPDSGPYCYSPTVLTDVPAEAKLFRGEVFGPVLAVSSYFDLEDAIAEANDTEYGLNASVVGPQAAAIAVAKRLNAGSVNVNEGYRASFASMESPMGGMKLSGLGRRNGPAGLLKYTNAKSIGVARDGLLAGFLRLPNRASEWKRMAPLFGVILRWMRRF